MNGPLFVRPNLKWIVIAALLIGVVHQLTTSGRSAPPKLAASMARPATPGYANPELQQLIAYAAENPSPEAYRRVSLYYERCGEIRKALLFLREAEKLEDPFD